MAIVFNTPGKGISEYKAISDATCKEGIWYLQWESEEIAKEQKKYLIGVGLNYYIKNSKNEYKMIDKCGGAIPFDGGAFVDIRKPQTSETVYMALNVLVTEDYDLEYFNFNVAFELSSFTGGEEKSKYTEGCIDGSLAAETCKKYKIAKGATNIRLNVFRGLTTLEEVEVPTTVTSIAFGLVGESYVGAFTGCTGLKTIKDISKVTEIGVYLFKDCSLLTSLDISGADVVYASAFWGCSALNTIKIKNGAFVFGFTDGNYSNKHLFATIPDASKQDKNYYLTYTDSSKNKIKIFVDSQTITLSASQTSGTLNNVTFTFSSRQAIAGLAYGVTVNWTE